MADYPDPVSRNREVGFFVFVAANRMRDNRCANGSTSAVVGCFWGSVGGLFAEPIGGMGLDENGDLRA